MAKGSFARMGEERISMSSPDLTESERAAVAKVLQTPRLSMGPEIEAFESAVAGYVGANHAVAVSSGTAALHLAVRALGIGEGDLALTTPFSFVASANVLLYERAVPIFVAVDPATGNIDTEVAAQATRDLVQGGRAAQRWLPSRGSPIEGHLKAILSVDVFGQPADYDQLVQLAGDYNLALIEDSCEALGAQYKDRMAGTLGNIGAFAFYPNKQITTGEGGMAVTDNGQWAEIMRALRNQGRMPGDGWLEHTHLGYNYRMSELNAALGRVQMTRLDELLDKRAQVAAHYARRLTDIPGVEVIRPLRSTTRTSWFVYTIRLDPGVDRAAVMAGLEARGVPSRPYFNPIHLQPYFAERFGYRPGAFRVAEELGQRSLALPFSSVMGEAQVEWVCQALGDVLREI